jgi:hypothetical protein
MQFDRINGHMHGCDGFLQPFYQIAPRTDRPNQKYKNENRICLLENFEWIHRTRTFRLRCTGISGITVIQKDSSGDRGGRAADQHPHRFVCGGSREKPGKIRAKGLRRVVTGHDEDYTGDQYGQSKSSIHRASFPSNEFGSVDSALRLFGFTSGESKCAKEDTTS